MSVLEHEDVTAAPIRLIPRVFDRVSDTGTRRQRPVFDTHHMDSVCRILTSVFDTVYMTTTINRLSPSDIPLSDSVSCVHVRPCVGVVGKLLTTGGATPPLGQATTPTSSPATPAPTPNSSLNPFLPRRDNREFNV
jgi:hypothetical protein